MNDDVPALDGRGGAPRPDRAAYRAFVREHHPDRGGDVEAFVAGLAAFRSAERERRAATRVSRSEGAAGRGDAPIVAVVRPHGLRAAAEWLCRWWSRHVRKPRVR